MISNQLHKTFCCVCGKVFETKIPTKEITHDFCSDKCWNNAPPSLTDLAKTD